MPETQMPLEFAGTGTQTAHMVLERIRAKARTESEKGLWFEQLFMIIALQEPEFEIDGIWRWRDWPARQELTEQGGGDIGIDLVARRTTGEWVAIQCKCYQENQTIGTSEIDKFLGASQQAIFSLRWLVATCKWNKNAENRIRKAKPQVAQIDFGEFFNVEIEEKSAKRPVQEPWPLQAEAITNTVEGLAEHDRGRLIMACGTGRT